MADVNCLLVLWLLFLIPQSSTLSSDDKKTLPEIALYLIREHISNLTSTIVIAEHSTAPDLANRNSQVLNYVLKHLGENIAVQFYISDYHHQPLEYYVFIVDSLDAFKKLYHLLKDTPFERHFRFLIILTAITPDFLNDMEEIFKICHHIDVIDVNIIAEHSTNDVHMFTYFLFSEGICHRSLPVHLFSFNKGFKHFQKIFPKKLQNFHKCPFKVSARVYPPYFTFNGNKSHPESIKDWENISGIEGTLLKFLATALNFTIDLRPFSKQRTYVGNNKTSGCLLKLKNGETDIAVGGFVDSNDSRWIFSPTTSHHSSVFWFVVRGKNMLDSFARLAKPFSKQVWILVSGFLLLTILFTSVLKIVKLKVHQFTFGEENRNPVTNFLAVFLGYSIIQTPRRNFARYIFSQLLLLTLVLRNAYQGSLYDAFRMDGFAWTPSGYLDLIKWNYTILLHPDAYRLYSDFPKERIVKVESEGYEPRLEMLEALEGRYATVAISDIFLYYLQNNLRNGSELLHLPVPVYNYQFVMFLRKHSIYLSAFNKKIKELAAAGIMAKIVATFKINDQLVAKYLMYQQLEKIPLRNKRLYALYNICGILIVISAVVFCLEILSVHNRRIQIIFRLII